MHSSPEQNTSLMPTTRHLFAELAVATVAALVAKFLEPLIPTGWGQWSQRVTNGLFGAAGLYVAFVIWKFAKPRYQTWTRERQIERRVREPLLRAAQVFNEAMSQSHAKCCANILNSLKIDPLLHNQYLAHVSTFRTIGGWIAFDVDKRRLSADDGLHRLQNVHADYLRLCANLASIVAINSGPDISRAWDEIRDHANQVSNQLIELLQEVQMARGEEGSPRYFQNVPRA
jgi:hypothetical protein